MVAVKPIGEAHGVEKVDIRNWLTGEAEFGGILRAGGGTWGEGDSAIDGIGAHTGAINAIGVGAVGVGGVEEGGVFEVADFGGADGITVGNRAVASGICGVVEVIDADSLEIDFIDGESGGGQDGKEQWVNFHR